MKFITDILDGMFERRRKQAEEEAGKRKMRPIGSIEFHTTIVDDEGKPIGQIAQHVAVLTMNALGDRKAFIHSTYDYMVKRHTLYPRIMAWESGGPLPSGYKPMQVDQAIRDMLVALVDKEFDLKGEEE